MGLYIESNLLGDERVSFNMKWHWSYYIYPVVFTLLTLGIGSPWLIYRIIMLKTSELAVTDRRILGKFGIISRRVLDISLDKIDALQMDQGLVERIFNSGRLKFKNDGEYIVVPLNISDPRNIKNSFSEAQHNFKAKLYGGRM